MPLFSTYIPHLSNSVFRISYQAQYLQDQQDNLFVPDRPFLLLRQPDLLLEVSHGAQPFPRLPSLPIAFAGLQHPFLVRPTDQLAPSLFAVLVQEQGLQMTGVTGARNASTAGISAFTGYRGDTPYGQLLVGLEQTDQSPALPVQP
ncbi:MAG: hypothetical protein MUO64_16000 [Anaerolineales bacterium]|nr:hypothetical protein [Anaerolineales bacterium]